MFNSWSLGLKVYMDEEEVMENRRVCGCQKGGGCKRGRERAGETMAMEKKLRGTHKDSHGSYTSCLIRK